MDTKVVVLLADLDDPKRGEITVLDDAKDAERLVETLLDGGCGQERIRILAGAEISPQVSGRSVVALPIDNGLSPTAADPAPAEADEKTTTGDAPSSPSLGPLGPAAAPSSGSIFKVEAPTRLRSLADGAPYARLSDQAPIESVPPLPEIPEKRGRRRVIGAAD